jgi:hypothetical protein
MHRSGCKWNRRKSNILIVAPSCVYFSNWWRIRQCGRRSRRQREKEEEGIRSGEDEFRITKGEEDGAGAADIVGEED